MTTSSHLVAAVLIAALVTSKGCTDIYCVHPFKFCDEDTGPCQMVRSNNFPDWEENGFFAMDKVVDVGCSADGDYPSENCEMFYRCRNGSSSLMSCDSPGYPFFDAVLGRCSHTKRSASFDCFNMPHLKVGLKGHASPFFAYCFTYNGAHYMFPNPSQKRHLITRCYGQDIFDVASQRCHPRCLQEGLIPDTSDCHNYYLCRLKDTVNNIFSMDKCSCPEGQGFLELEHRCDSETLVPACLDPFPYPV